MFYDSIHNEDLYTNGGSPRDVVGDFHGTPIIGWKESDTRTREEFEVKFRLRDVGSSSGIVENIYDLPTPPEKIVENLAWLASLKTEASGVGGIA